MKPRPCYGRRRILITVSRLCGISLLLAAVLTGCEHPDHMDPFLVCVRAAESDTMGGYVAHNPISTASGAYEYIDSTWRKVAPMAGVHGYSRAMQAPPFAQDQVASFTIHAPAKQTGGYGNWKGDHCGHGT